MLVMLVVLVMCGVVAVLVALARGAPMAPNRTDRLGRVAVGRRRSFVTAGSTLSATWSPAPQAGRDHAGPVDDQQMARGKEIGEITKSPVLPGPAPAPDDHHARFVAAGERTLGYEFCRQRKFEVGELHTN